MAFRRWVLLAVAGLLLDGVVFAQVLNTALVRAPILLRRPLPAVQKLLGIAPSATHAAPTGQVFQNDFARIEVVAEDNAKVDLVDVTFSATFKTPEAALAAAGIRASGKPDRRTKDYVVWSENLVPKTVQGAAVGYDRKAKGWRKVLGSTDPLKDETLRRRGFIPPAPPPKAPAKTKPAPARP